MDDLNAVLDQPVEQTTETVDTSTPVVVDVQDQTDAQPSTEDFGSYDGRKFGKDFNTAITDIRKNFPQYDKQIQSMRDGYGRYLAVSELAPKGVTELKGWKTTIDSIGGPDGAANLLERMNNFEQLEQKLAAGDPSVFDADNLKGAVSQLTPAFVERMAKDSPDEFGQIVAPHFAARLATTGLDKLLSTMYQQAEGNPDLQKNLQEAYAWFQRNTQSPSAPGQGAKPPVDRARQQFETERAEFEKQKSEQFWTGVRTSVDQYQNDAVTKALDPYLKSLNLTDERKARLVENVKTGLARKADADPAYTKSLNAYKQARNPNADSISALVKGKIDSSLDTVVQDEISYISAAGGTRKTAPAATPGAGTETTTPAGTGGPIRVAEQPKNIDFRRTSDELLFKNHGYTTDGKFVQWPFKTKVAVN